MSESEPLISLYSIKCWVLPVPNTREDWLIEERYTRAKNVNEARDRFFAVYPQYLHKRVEVTDLGDRFIP